MADIWRKLVAKFTSRPEPKLDPWSRRQRPLGPRVSIAERYPRAVLWGLTVGGTGLFFSRFIYDSFFRAPPTPDEEMMHEPIDWSALTFGKVDPEKAEYHNQRYLEKIRRMQEHTYKGVVTFVADPKKPGEE